MSVPDSVSSVRRVSLRPSGTTAAGAGALVGQGVSFIGMDLGLLYRGPRQPESESRRRRQ